MAQAQEKKQYNSHAEETPSMEDILNSIRGVISGDDDAGEDDDILELTEVIEDEDYANTNEAKDPYLEKSILDDIDEALGSTKQNTEDTSSKNINTANNQSISLNHHQKNIQGDSVGDNNIRKADSINENPLDIKPQTLLNEETIKESSTSLKTLVNSLNDKNTDSIYTRRGTSLEDLVMEAMKPFLAEWLNKNLAVIVKKIVEKEVKRLIPKEEDDN